MTHEDEAIRVQGELVPLGRPPSVYDRDRLLDRDPGEGFRGPDLSCALTRKKYISFSGGLTKRAYQFPDILFFLLGFSSAKISDPLPETL